MRVVLTSFLAIMLVGCQSSAVSTNRSPRPSILNGRDAEVRERLLAEIPIGTTLTKAEEIVRANGLRCSQEIDEKTNMPFLSCGYSERVDMLVTMVWQIRIDCPDGLVSDIQCHQTGVGP